MEYTINNFKKGHGYLDGIIIRQLVQGNVWTTVPTDPDQTTSSVVEAHWQCVHNLDTGDRSAKEVKFLNTWVYISNEKVETDLHVKSTSKHQYLHTKSCHPEFCKNAIPYNQAHKIKRTCSERENYSLGTNQSKYYLSKTGYSEQLLDSEINQAIIIHFMTAALCAAIGRNSNQVPLVVTYHPNLPKLERTFRYYHHIQQDSDRLWEAFPSLPMIGFSWLRNLRDLY